MRYRITESLDKGILIDRTPVMKDIKDTFILSFDMPSDGDYVALLRGTDNVEYKLLVKNNEFALPKELLKEQYAGLIIARIEDKKIVRSWECESIRITSFLNLRQNQWQISGGADDTDCRARLAELEILHGKTNAEFAKLSADTASMKNSTALSVTGFKQDLEAQIKSVVSLSKDNAALTAAYNKSVAVINDLSKRLVELEKNYDPTLIK